MHNILIIEDQEDLRELIRYNLERLDLYEVTESGNANDALILMEDISVDLILLDLMLPGLKGLEFLKIIKSNPDYDHIAVVIISAKTDEEDIVKGLNLGADDYLTKPFSIKVLMAKVESILRRVLSQEKSVYSYKEISLNLVTFQTMVAGKEVRLTRKEQDLLLLFIKNPKKAFHRNQLLAHIASLRKKLGESGKLIHSLSKIGYGLEI